MSGRVDKRLAELDISLPQPPAPVAAYVPFVQTGNLVFIAGQVCFIGDDRSLSGKVGKTLSVDQGYQAARNSALNTIAQLKAACDGNLDQVKRCVSLRVFIASPGEFTDHPIFGEAGKHARAAVGAPALPLDCAVEIESVWEID